jgi:hypothetical protein
MDGSMLNHAEAVMAESKEPTPEPLLITQKDIAARYGIPSRDIILALKKGYNFPTPVRIIGKKRWFRRSDVAKFFKDRPEESDTRQP